MASSAVAVAHTQVLIPVLLVEDNYADFRLLTESLKDLHSDEFELVHAESLGDAAKKLKERAYHAVLLDLSLPDSDGLDTFLELHRLDGGIPIIVLSGLDDEAVATEAVRNGAQDYLVKGQVSGSLLSRSIKYAIERAASDRNIRESLRQKEVLLKEIHHRVKNNLQVISSLLSLQSRHTANKEARVMFDESRNRVLSMALVHEELYRSENFERIDFGGYVHNLANNLLRSYSVSPGAVEIDCDVPQVFINIDTAIPCGLIINEILSNALKHAFPEGRAGRVAVKVAVDSPGENGKRKFTITISDNGVGFPAQVEFKKSRTLGLELVQALVVQIGGSVECQSGSAGTSFMIRFCQL